MPENQQEKTSWGGAIKGFVGMAVAGAVLTGIGAAIGMPFLGLAAKFLFAGSGMMLAAPLLPALTKAIGSVGRGMGSSRESASPPPEDRSLKQSHTQQQANAQTLRLPPEHDISKLAQQLSASALELSKAVSKISAQAPAAVLPPQRLDADGNRITKPSDGLRSARKRVVPVEPPSVESVSKFGGQPHDRDFAFEGRQFEGELEREAAKQEARLKHAAGIEQGAAVTRKASTRSLR